MNNVPPLETAPEDFSDMMHGCSGLPDVGATYEQDMTTLA